MSLAQPAGMSNNRLSLFIASLVILGAACGGSGKNPVAPGSTAGTPSDAAPGGGATISGMVQTGAASSQTPATSGPAMPGLVVKVTGTSISSGFDAAGRFSLNGVPPGDVQLEFSGPVTATLPVNQ